MKNFKAGIFDLDGVITRTARHHKKAWRKLFDNFRQYLRRKGEPTFEPYQEEDYIRYIDGRPRHDGLRAFLKSRDIELPEGSPDDGMEDQTIYGLGNYKNQLFLQILEEEGVDVYTDAINRIRQWKEKGLKTAIISASKNCQYILKKAKLQDLFQVRIDGVVAEECGLAGKPAPDIFLEATKELNVSPREAFIVEDSIAGIRAGAEGNFGLVVGIVRNADEEELREAGADLVISRLGQLDLSNQDQPFPEELPNAYEEKDKIKKRLDKKEPVLFLDFDGTLAPIVNDREKAHIDPKIRTTLEKMVPHFRLIAVVSGRDLLDVKKRVNIEHLYYLGSHGFELSGPGDINRQQPEAVEMLSQLENAEHEAERLLQGVKGTDVERKRFAIALHYRLADKKGEEKVKQTVRDIVRNHPELKRSAGKKVAEIRPDVEWDKGKAITWLIREMNLQKSKFTPLYIGDDITDEDAYRELRNSGIGIQVGSHGKRTRALYYLQDVQEVGRFLDWLLKVQKKRRSKEA
jgi:trehalose 6-phosphate phosphatase